MERNASLAVRRPRDPLPGSVSRRELVAGSVGAALTVPLWGSRPAQAAPARPARLEVRKPAKHVIFVLMSGAPSQLETFDPKPGAPTGGPFGTIATGIPGI